MASPRRFCTALLISLACILAMVGVFDAVVDPYDVIGMERIAGLNAFKPQATLHGLMTKTYQVERVRPVTVLLGSSRVDLGLDPASAAWPAPMKPVFNYGIDGGSTFDAWRNLQEAAATGRLRHAVVLLDFEDFWLPRRTGPRGPSESERRYWTTPDGQANPDRRAQRLRDLFLSTLTLGALQDSIATVLAQRQSLPFDLRRDGLRTDGDFVREAEADGYSALFREKTKFAIPVASRGARSLARWQGAMPNLEIVGDIIAFCRQHGIALTLIISPTHAELLNVYQRVGLWPWFEAWKRQLASLLPPEASSSISLWDFSGYTPYSIEPVPAKGDRRTALRWFWELHHFKRALGDRLIGRIFRGTPADMGAELTIATLPDDIETHPDATSRLPFFIR